MAFSDSAALDAICESALAIALSRSFWISDFASLTILPACALASANAKL